MLYLLTLVLNLFIQTTPEEVVQKQLDTYNARDIEGFMSVMSKEVEVFNFGAEKPIASGYEEVKSLYSNLFNKSPELFSTLKNRMVMDNKVIDHESITGRMGSIRVIELVVIYEVIGQKISRITVIRPQQTS